MENPLELLYGWQALLCAAAATGITQLVKAIIDTVYEAQWKKLNDEEQKVLREKTQPKPRDRGGKIARKQSVIVTRFVLPMTPILVGFVYANVVPLRPEALLAYVEAHVADGLGWQIMAWGSWGAACGQFSNYLYDRLTKTLQALATQSAR